MTRAEEELLILVVLGALLLGFLAYTHLSPRENASLPDDPLSDSAQVEAQTQDIVQPGEPRHVDLDHTHPSTAEAFIVIPHEPATSARHPHREAEASLAVRGFRVEDLTDNPNQISTPSSGPVVASGQIRNVGNETWLEWVEFELAIFGTDQEPLAQERFVVRFLDDPWLPGVPKPFSVGLPSVEQQHITGFGMYFVDSAAEPLPTTDVEAPPEEEAPTTDVEAPVLDEETKRKAEDKASAAAEDELASAARC